MAIKGAEELVERERLSGKLVPFNRFNRTLVAVTAKQEWVDKKRTNKRVIDGKEVEVPRISLISYVVPLEDGSFTDDDGEVFVWEAGQQYVSFVGAARVKRQLEFDETIVGRLKKSKPLDSGVRPWILEPATIADMQLAEKVLANVTPTEEAPQSEDKSAVPWAK